MRLRSDLNARRDLHALGTGADSYQLEVDQERGVLLAATAIRGEQPFYKITTLAISFDEPIPAETFQFRPPEGEQIQSQLEIRDRLQHYVTPTEAQQHAAFTVVIPGGGSAGWHVHCTFVEACRRPPVPAYVLLGCRSHDGQHSVSILQMSRADAAQHYRNTIKDESWQKVVREGISIKIKPAGEWPHRSQAHLQRNGTFLHLSSDNLTGDELATIAAGLRPAPSTGSI